MLIYMTVTYLCRKKTNDQIGYYQCKSHKVNQAQNPFHCISFRAHLYPVFFKVSGSVPDRIIFLVLSPNLLTIRKALPTGQKYRQ
jgi:hypothetical protein